MRITQHIRDIQKTNTNKINKFNSAQDKKTEQETKNNMLYLCSVFCFIQAVN